MTQTSEHAHTRAQRIAAGRAAAQQFMDALRDTTRFGRTHVTSTPTFHQWLDAQGERLLSTDGELRGTLDRIFAGLCPSTATRHRVGRADGQIREAASAQRHNAALRARYAQAQRDGTVTVTEQRVGVNLNSPMDRALIRVTLKRERRRAQRAA